MRRKQMADRVWSAFSSGGMVLVRGGFLGKASMEHFYVDKVADLKAFNQIKHEAGIVDIGSRIHEDAIDKFIKAASKWDIPIILQEPDTAADTPSSVLPKNVFRQN